jgi:uncharacterized protein (TIGR00251 family)
VNPVPAWPCLSPHGEGVALRLAVVPNAKRTEVDGMHDGALRVRLAAPPMEGRANDELVAWLAKSLGVQRRAISLAQGASGRRKRVLIDVPLATAEAWLARVLAAAGS